MNEASRTVLSYVAETLGGLFLFAATVGVVWWQNTRLTVLYDLSGVLEPATRIAQGDMPYRDFPFPYAPLTFVTQAALIRLTGAIYWHHIVYACVVAGLATVLAWRIITCLFTDDLPRPRLTAFLLSLPVTFLGVYCIFPHPFYDPDTAFVVLLSVWLLLMVERRGFPIVPTFLVGALFIVTLFFKQNIGLAFCGSIGLWLIAMTVYGLRTKTSVRPYLTIFGGMVAGFCAALLILHLTCGIDNYKYWTLEFATARRTPSIADMLSVYADWTLVVWAVLFVVGAWLVIGNRDGRRSGYVVGTFLMALPFAWPVVYLFLETDASERAERLVGVWPLVFIVLIAIAYLIARRLSGVAAALPFILIATAHGVFLSQQLWGSTYGIWPLLVVMIALVVRQLFDEANPSSGVPATVLSGWIAVCLLIAGGVYVYSNERLDYVDFEDGEMAHSTLPQLVGLSMRGDFLPDFDELVRYTDTNIPREDGIIYLPGEDLFYYTTQRHPHFPVLLFDVTNNPYNTEEIRARVEASDIEWLIVKNDTEIETDNTIDSKDAIFDLLKPYFRSVESLNNYEIYKRRHAGDPPDEEDDGSDDDDEPSNN